MYSIGMSNKTLEQKITELKAFILEAREDGLNNIADMWADELQTVLANAQLVGNKPNEK